ncbi:glycerate kinase [Robinsoniella peoriensis]|uniref:glycerate kinase family protein n=1 Tax=Robinsoniella peoriensis TaxID=180332 RepID=UPI00085BD396|nr:glycerate kinase [Robinsoniella peoriensis]
MKVVVAIDSLKGSLSSMEAGGGIRAGIKRVYPDAEVIVKPLADGGEGTVEAFVEGCGGTYISRYVCGPMREPVNAAYGFIPDKKQAVIEIAAAAGITLVKAGGKKPLSATTFGVGELIVDAINRGCRNFMIGIGGSATNDAGIGMLTALGYRFLDKEGNPVGISADSLKLVASIKTDAVNPVIRECTFRIACDVNNPLCGTNGATWIYGPQKGVTDEMKEVLDRDLQHFADVTAHTFGHDYSGYQGAGAAGGLGFAFLSFLNGTLSPGIDLVMKAVDLEEEIADADFVITGEGRLDLQTAMGKAPVGVAGLAKKHGIKVIAFAGSVSKDAVKCNEKGIDAYFPILQEITTLEQAMDSRVALTNITNAAEQVFRLIKSLD